MPQMTDERVRAGLTREDDISFTIKSLRHTRGEQLRFAWSAGIAAAYVLRLFDDLPAKQTHSHAACRQIQQGVETDTVWMCFLLCLHCSLSVKDPAYIWFDDQR